MKLNGDDEKRLRGLVLQDFMQWAPWQEVSDRDKVLIYMAIRYALSRVETQVVINGDEP